MGEKIERTFYSDASHNYMVIECPQELKNNYQYKMLAANQIRGLLPCSSRSIDSSEYLYYDITSRQSLEDLYDRVPVRGADLEKLLEDLIRVEKTLTEYLLDSSHMILEPSCIYLDFMGKECSFVYYPGECGDTQWETLFTFLADRVDGKDKRAAALIYRLCMMSEKPGFRLTQDTLEDMGIRTEREKVKDPAADRRFAASGRGRSDWYDTIFPDPEAEKDPYGRASERQYRFREDNSNNYEWEYVSGFRKDAASTSAAPGQSSGFSDGRSEQEEGRKENGVSGKRKGKKIRQGALKWQYILAALLIPAGAGLIMLGMIRSMGEREVLLCLGSGGFMIALGIVLGTVCLIRFRRGGELRKAGSRSSEADAESSIEDREPSLEELMYGAGVPSERWDRYPSFGDTERSRGPTGISPAGKSPIGKYSIETFPTGDSPEGKSFGGKSFGGRSFGGKYLEGKYLEGKFPIEKSPIGFSPAGVTPPEEDSTGSYGTRAGKRAPVIQGETCLLGPDAAGPTGLYGTGSCRGEQISLTEVPCVVGKMREYVDQVLDDSSISRMHARFSVDRRGEMSVRDLNSTNGTWLNGERLMPNESRIIRQGDRIRLGRMEFVYR